MMTERILMDKNKKGLNAQISVIVIVCILITAVATYSVLHYVARSNVENSMRIKASQAAQEVILSIKEYPAYRWLISYWIEHAEDMNVEYDVDYGDSTATQQKVKRLMQRHPGFDLEYCDSEEVEALPEEDQKMYAEVCYSWLIARMDNIKVILNCDYLSCLVTDTDSGEHPYEDEVFLLSAAGKDSVRGTEYGHVYTLGVTKSIADDDRVNGLLREAVDIMEPSSGEIALVCEDLYKAGNYVDYYTCMEIIDDKAILLDVTYKLKEMLSDMRMMAAFYSLIALFFQLVLVRLIMERINRYMLVPLKDIIYIIRAYTENKDSEKVEKSLKELFASEKTSAVRQNEIGQLAEDFYVLTQEIDDYMMQIEADAEKKKLIEYELLTASNIQAHMLPDPNPVFPDHPEFELCASMTPAREVGGDFYDYFLVDDGRLVLVMADVSDKGVPAALFMAEAKSLIKSRAETGGEPGQILYNVNNRLCETNEAGYFVTVWLAVIDLKTGEGIAANAGHEHPVICRAGGDYELVIYKHNIAIGMMEDAAYRQHTFKLNPGDRLYVYTDGVPEANNMSQEQFGTDRMLEALNSRKEASPRELLAAVSEAIDSFMGDAPRFDDTTMMCLFYKGEGQACFSNDVPESAADEGAMPEAGDMGV